MRCVCVDDVQRTYVYVSLLLCCDVWWMDNTNKERERERESFMIIIVLYYIYNVYLFTPPSSSSSRVHHNVCSLSCMACDTWCGGKRGKASAEWIDIKLENGVSHEIDRVVGRGPCCWFRSLPDVLLDAF